MFSLIDITVEVVGKKKAFSVNLSITVRIASYPCDSGKGPIKSSATVCHGPWGTSCGCNGATFFD